MTANAVSAAIAADMIINADLRLAIKAAAAAQPQDSYENRKAQDQAAIAAFLKKFPAKAKRARGLLKTAQDASRVESDARKALCDDYGLQKGCEGYGHGEKPTEFEFSHCNRNNKAFLKAGGVIPTKNRRWSADEMMAQIAAAEPKEAKAILKSLGIIWE